jgi:(1->4)-alpha-D-glucan 1-alpha-D-glucosylmutase
VHLYLNGLYWGLRIDHIDGLYQPLRYLRALRQRFDDLYIVVEKILNLQERLPPEWPVQGTTGYDFLNYVNGRFCDPNAKGPLTECYHAFTGARQDWPDVLAESKRLIMGKFLECDLSYLSRLAIQAADRIGFRLKSDPEEDLRQALKEFIAEFNVYRTYADEELSPQDARQIELAIERALEQPRPHRKELKLIRTLLTEAPTDQRPPGEAEEFALRIQQLTGPVMAKGLEDTALYRYNRLISLNEVGGEPAIFGVSSGEFDNYIGERAWTFAYSMNATSTHDTKRGEDARARLNVLTEMPDLWRQAVEQWATLNEDCKRKTDAGFAPSKNDEYLLYQAMIGSFPFESAQEADFVRRLKEFAVKAAREAKVHTNWTDPQPAYEEALTAFIDDITQPASDFLKAFRAFSRQTSYFGMFNSLSQTLIRLAAPGVPDFYQGSELWNLSMVDPDNRGPVDFIHRSRLLDNIRAACGQNVTALLEEMLASMEDGRVKMYLVWKMLHLRAGFRDLFERGDYVPLEVRGPLSGHLHAFARVFGERAAVIAAPRLLSNLIAPEQMPFDEVWGETEIILPTPELPVWYDCFTEARLDLEHACRVAGLLTRFPVACIVNVPEYRLKPVLA